MYTLNNLVDLSLPHASGMFSFFVLLNTNSHTTLARNYDISHNKARPPITYA